MQRIYLVNRQCEKAGYCTPDQSEGVQDMRERFFRWGSKNDFSVVEASLVKKNQDDRIESITSFKKRYTQCTVGSGAFFRSWEFWRIFALKIALQSILKLQNKLGSRMY